MTEKATNELLAAANAAYRESTLQVSTGVRALALSFVAVSWLFLGGFSDTPQNPLDNAVAPTSIKWALGLAIAALLLDVSQYVYWSWRSQRFADSLEVVFAAARDPRNTEPNMRHWMRLYRLGFVEDMLWDTSGINAINADDSKTLIKTARKLLQSVLTDPDSPKAGDDKAVTIFLQNQWEPKVAVWVLTLIYWTKVLLLAGSGVALLLYVFFR